MKLFAKKFTVILLLIGILVPAFLMLAAPLKAAAQIDDGANRLRSIEKIVDDNGVSCGWWTTIFTLELDCLLLDVVWAVDKFLMGWVLYFATNVFSWSIGYNLVDITQNNNFVRIGWGIVHDITNLFFIFVLLWIALATIFNIPGYGAKDLLAKLIIAALLVNFSLAIGGFVINLTNALGRTFYDAITAEGDLTNKLLAFTSIQKSTTQPLNAQESVITKTQNNESTCDQAARRYADSAAPNRPPGDPLWQSIYNQSMASCMENPNTTAWAESANTTIAELEARKNESGKIMSAFYQALWLLIILPILAFVFFAGAIFFLIRYLQLSLLLIFAPIVFFTFILPATRKFWNEWWDNLLKWAFFAPAFLFLLYLTIETFPALAAANVQGVKGFLGIGFDMVLFVALMIMNLLVAQKAGIYGASAVTGWGNRAAGWVGKKAKGAAYRGAVRVAEPAAKAVTESRVGRFLAQTPGLRGLTQPALAIQEQRAKIDEDRAKQVERAAAVSPDLALARFKGESMAVKAAYAKSASPDNMRKLMVKMNPAEQESFVADLHANRAKYRIDESELAKKIGDAMSKDANGLTLRVVAKTGIRAADPNFQNEVNKYLDGLTDREFNDALTPPVIGENSYAIQYITKNFNGDKRMVNAVLSTPEKAKAFKQLAEATAEVSPGYQDEKGAIPERQITRVHMDYLASAMKREGNNEGVKVVRSGPFIRAIAGAGSKPYFKKEKPGPPARQTPPPPPPPPPPPTQPTPPMSPPPPAAHPGPPLPLPPTHLPPSPPTPPPAPTVIIPPEASRETQEEFEERRLRFRGEQMRFRAEQEEKERGRTTPVATPPPPRQPPPSRPPPPPPPHAPPTPPSPPPAAPPRFPTPPPPLVFDVPKKPPIPPPRMPPPVATPPPPAPPPPPEQPNPPAPPSRQQPPF